MSNSKIVQKILNKLFPHPEIALKFSDPYTLLIAVLLSAQCTDKRVNLVTPYLPQTPQEMCKLSLTEIEKIIKSCGFFRVKAKAIRNLSCILIEKYKGKVPKTFKALEALPGVGHKTASVVLSQAFQIPAFPVDTHIHRCAKRWGLSSGKNVVQTELDLKKLFPKKTWNKLHLQIISYARIHCPAKAHKLHNCPICQALARSIP